MATRTVYLTIESGGYTTKGEGEWIDFYVTSGGEAFGIYEPYAIEIDFSGVTSYYGSSVTHKWKIKLAGDGSYGNYGDNYYTIAEFSKAMYDDTANFDLSYTSLNSDAINLLKTQGLTNIGIFQVGTRKIVGKSSASAIATIYYNEPSYDWDSGPTITSIKNNNNGEYTIKWSAANWQGGNTYVRYDVFIYQGSTYVSESDYLTSLSHTALIPKYDTELTFYVRASLSSGSNSTIKSETVKKIFNSPTLSKPTISLSNNKGQSVTITRGDSQVNDGSATSIAYDLYRDSNKVGTFSGKTYTINQSTLENWNQTNIIFKIKATASGVSPVVNNNSKLTSESNTATFTFEPYKTILYYTGSGPINGYEECIVYYYTGNSNEGNNGWVECEPYIYTGESNATINGWQLCSYT